MRRPRRHRVAPTGTSSDWVTPADIRFEVNHANGAHLGAVRMVGTVDVRLLEVGDQVTFTVSWVDVPDRPPPGLD